jgi:hypothetical protein
MGRDRPGHEGRPVILIIAALLGLVGTAALGLAAHGLWISRERASSRPH